MKAKVQYDDLLGSAAADKSDYIWIDSILLKRRVDTERYEAIGASFYAGYSDFFSASIICIDKQKSTADKKYIVDLSFENKFTQEEFFNLFKRFKVIITKDHGSFEDLEIDEEIIFDDRN
jgi:hypothetical protein